MTVLTRWEPFRELSTLQDRMNRLFRESYNEPGRDESLVTSGFAPAVDVYEDEHNVTLPNTVDTENVQANYDKGVLKITLPKKAEAKPKQIKVNVSSGSSKAIEGKTPEGKASEAKGPSKAA